MGQREEKFKVLGVLINQIKQIGQGLHIGNFISDAMQENEWSIT